MSLFIRDEEISLHFLIQFEKDAEMERRNKYQKDKEIMKHHLQKIKPCPVNTKMSFSLEVCEQYVCIKYFEKLKLSCNAEGVEKNEEKRGAVMNRRSCVKCSASTRNRESPLSFGQYI